MILTQNNLHPLLRHAGIQSAALLGGPLYHVTLIWKVILVELSARHFDLWFYIAIFVDRREAKVFRIFFSEGLFGLWNFVQYRFISDLLVIHSGCGLLLDLNLRLDELVCMQNRRALFICAGYCFLDGLQRFQWL